MSYNQQEHEFRKKYANHLIPNIYPMKDKNPVTGEKEVKSYDWLSEKILIELVDNNITCFEGTCFMNTRNFEDVLELIYRQQNFYEPGKEEFYENKFLFSDKFWAFISFHLPRFAWRSICYEPKRLIISCIEKLKIREIKFLVQEVKVSVNPILTDREDLEGIDWPLKYCIQKYEKYPHEMKEILEIIVGNVDLKIVRRGRDIWSYIDEIKSSIYRKEIESILGKKEEIDYKLEYEKAKIEINGLKAQIQGQKELINSLQAVIISRGNK